MVHKSDFLIEGDLVVQGTTTLALAAAVHDSFLVESGGQLFRRALNLGGSLLPAGTEGQTLYSNGGVWTAHSGVFWDDTNGRLGIGVSASLGARLHVRSANVGNPATFALLVQNATPNELFSLRDDGRINGIGPLTIFDDIQTGGRLVSTAATGIAPVVVASTTLCPGLNADLLDGQHGAWYLDAVNHTLPSAFIFGTPVTSRSLPHLLNRTWDALAFRPIVDLEYWDGYAWVPYVNSGIQGLLTGRIALTGANVDQAHRRFRFTWLAGAFFGGLMVQVHTEWSDRWPDTAGIVLETAPAQAGPWETIIPETVLNRAGTNNFSFGWNGDYNGGNSWYRLTVIGDPDRPVVTYRGIQMIVSRYTNGNLEASGPMVPMRWTWDRVVTFPGPVVMSAAGNQMQAAAAAGAATHFPAFLLDPSAGAQPVWSRTAAQVRADIGADNAANLVQGTLPSARLAGAYPGITGTGTLVSGSIVPGFGAINIGNNGLTAGLVIAAFLAVSGTTTLTLTPAGHESFVVESGGQLFRRSMPTGGGFLPVGTEGQTLYNNNGVWTAHSGVFWEDTSNRLGVGISSGVLGKLHVRSNNVAGPSTYALYVQNVSGTNLLVLSDDGRLALSGALAVTGAVTLSSTLAAGAVTAASLTVTGATVLSSTLGVTGAVTLSSTLAVAGNATFSGGELVFTNGVANWLRFSSLGLNPPTITGTRSTGTRLIFGQTFISGASTDYALGGATDQLWFSVAAPTAAHHFRWYGGATAVANLDGSGSWWTQQRMSCRADTSGAGNAHYGLAVTNGTGRIDLGLTGAETGSNTGSNFMIRCWSDVSTILTVPLQISRATGLTTLLSLAMSSTALCANLNADLLDGQHGVWYQSVLNHALPLQAGLETPSLGTPASFLLNQYWDTLAFQPVSDLEYWDGYAWVPWSNAVQIQRLFHGRPVGGTTQVPATHRQFRFTVNLGPFLFELMPVVFQEWSANGIPRLTLQLERSMVQSGGTWTTVIPASTTTGSNLNFSQFWRTGPAHHAEGWYRLTITSSETDFDTNYACIQVLAPRRIEVANGFLHSGPVSPFLWDSQRNVSFPGSAFVFNNSVSSLLLFSSLGSGPPQLFPAVPVSADRSPGTKIVIFPFTSLNRTDYAIGYDGTGGALWQSVPFNNSTFAFHWYGGNTRLMTLQGNAWLGLGTAAPLITLDVRGPVRTQGWLNINNAAATPAVTSIDGRAALVLGATDTPQNWYFGLFDSAPAATGILGIFRWGTNWVQTWHPNGGTSIGISGSTAPIPPAGGLLVQHAGASTDITSVIVESTVAAGRSLSFFRNAAAGGSSLVVISHGPAWSQNWFGQPVNGSSMLLATAGNLLIGTHVHAAQLVLGAGDSAVGGAGNSTRGIATIDLTGMTVVRQLRVASPTDSLQAMVINGRTVMRDGGNYYLQGAETVTSNNTFYLGRESVDRLGLFSTNATGTGAWRALFDSDGRLGLAQGPVAGYQLSITGSQQLVGNLEVRATSGGSLRHALNVAGGGTLTDRFNLRPTAAGGTAPGFWILDEASGQATPHCFFIGKLQPGQLAANTLNFWSADASTQGTRASMNSSGFWGFGQTPDATGTHRLVVDGNIFLNNQTANQLGFAAVGAESPTLVTRSRGVRLNLWPSANFDPGYGGTDYAIGMESAGIWMGLPQQLSTMQFRWYGGTTPVAFLGGTGIWWTAADMTSRAGTSSGGVLHFVMSSPTGLRRWGAGLLGTETGANAGAAYTLWSYSDTGNFINAALSIARNTLVANFTVTPTVNNLPLWHAGNDGSGSGLDADLLDGAQGASIYASLRAHRAITGGGIISFSAASELRWTTRLIIVASGTGPHWSTNGFFQIDMPANGTTITGAGNAPDRAVTAGGIPLTTWEALYYILPIGGGSGGVAANFRVVMHGAAALEIPHNWVLLAMRSSDTNMVYLHSGFRLLPGGSVNTATSVSAFSPQIQTTPQAAPQIGDSWLDEAASCLKVYTSSGWKSVALV